MKREEILVDALRAIAGGALLPEEVARRALELCKQPLPTPSPESTTPSPSGEGSRHPSDASYPSILLKTSPEFAKLISDIKAAWKEAHGFSPRGYLVSEVNELLGLANEVGVVAILDGWHRYLGEDSDYQREHRHPLRTFLVQAERWVIPDRAEVILPLDLGAVDARLEREAEGHRQRLRQQLEQWRERQHEVQELAAQRDRGGF